MYENEILQSANFRTAMERLVGDRPLVAAVQKQLQALALGDITPGMDRMRVGRDPLRPIFKIRVNASDRLISPC